MLTASTLGCDNREHALFVNTEQDLGGRKMDKVVWMLLTWFEYQQCPRRGFMML